MAAPNPARISRCPAAGICAQNAAVRKLVTAVIAVIAGVVRDDIPGPPF